MSNNNSTPSRGGGLSLYANLLDPTNTSTPGSVAKAPVIFKQNSTETADEASKKPQIDAATLRFQPTKRPQLQQPKSKPKSNFPKAIIGHISVRDASPAVAKPAAKPTLEDWTNVEPETNYEGEKRQRGGRKKRKKNNRDEHVEVQDWDDIYDPTRPNSYEEYKHSDEKIREVRDWKDRLYAHRMARKSSEKDSDDEETYRPQMNSKFAPPSNYSFAPPPMDPPTRPPPNDNVDSDPYSPPPVISEPPPPPPTSGAISRAPVRYNLPAAPSDIPASQAELEKALQQEAEEDEEEAPRSLRPGQQGFAERLLSKYGWSKGTGLGADGSGIINPLRVQLEKRKKKSDAEGGGFRDLGGRGKIVGGQKKVADDEAGRFGPMSQVVVLRGMVDGMDLDAEVEGSGDGGLMQEIGDECGEKYGRVERVFIDRHEAAPKVFVKFTAELSALRAVNALEGRIFNGNTITALFYDTETFEKGIYNK